MYTLSPEYEETAREIIESVPDIGYLEDVPVAYLSCDKQKISKGHRIHGECIKVPEMYRAVSRYAFLIVIYEPNCAAFSDAQMKILIEHEMRHIGIMGDKTYIVPHDIELGEFNAISEKYGEDWSR